MGIPIIPVKERVIAGKRSQQMSTALGAIQCAAYVHSVTANAKLLSEKKQKVSK